MEKTFSTLKPLVDIDGKSKFCLKCGSRATKEALFDVDGAMLIEKYCDTCAETEPTTLIIMFAFSQFGPISKSFFLGLRKVYESEKTKSETSKYN